MITKKIIIEWIDNCLRPDYELGMNVTTNIEHLKKMVSELPTKAKE